MTIPNPFLLLHDDTGITTFLLFRSDARGVHLALREWPDKTLFTRALFIAPNDGRIFQLVDGEVRIRVVNGEAVYRLEDLGGDFLLGIKRSSALIHES